MTRDRVHTVSDFWDQPRSGVADYRGRPHAYDRQFDEQADEWSDLYWLMEIDSTLYALAVEQSAIYNRWVATWKKGEWPVMSHPYLPEDRQRHDELQQLIGDRLRPRPDLSVTQRGVFSYDASSAGWSVQWTNP